MEKFKINSFIAFFLFQISFSLNSAEIFSSEENVVLNVHKTSTCGCCKKWIEHLQDNGIKSLSTDHQNSELESLKDAYSIKPKYRSCHTGVSSDGYIFEGHIPSEFITKFLSENHKDAIGLSVPGMPLGSPGMEVGGRLMPYDVLILFKDGTSKVYAEVR
tara:strand:- start:1605 stop:2084 length:480 start_codon:yes stop_codon:yes gene_type:complete